MGPSSDVTRAHVTAAVHGLVRAGARVVVCTCSTLGGVAEATLVAGCNVMRVDRPATEHAVASGRRIVLVATLESALAEAVALVHQIASSSRVAPEVVPLSCTGAWEHFERNDAVAYVAAIARAIETTAVAGDVVLLAQASMAAVAGAVQLAGVQLVSTPRAGVEAAIAAYQRLRFDDTEA